MITIIIPCYNEKEIIKDFIDELYLNVKSLKDDFEIIFIDNKSTDNTVDILKENIEVFKNYKLICLSNYFGKEAAILSGLDKASGDASIIMDPDLEDPPSLIQELIGKWKEGNDVVYAQRKNTETKIDSDVNNANSEQHSMRLNKSYTIQNGLVDWIGRTPLQNFQNQILTQSHKSELS